MKQSPFRSRLARHSGFTLVELLVVIAIIAILAGTLLSVGTVVLNMAKRAKASSTVNTIQTAALAYYTEYSVYPVPTATTTDSLIGDASAADGASWATLICVLSGNIHPSDGTAFTAVAAGPGNTRAIPFLSLRSTDVFTAADVTANANGVKDAPKNPLPSSTSVALFFNIAFDSDYSGVMGNGAGTPASAITGASATTGLPNFALSTTTTMNWTGTSTSGVAVWGNCNGKTTSTNPNFWVKTY